MRYKFVDVEDETCKFKFTNNDDYNGEFKISPFRPEMFGTLIYPTLYYICNKFNIKFIMEGEANLLPLFSLYSDESIVYNLNKLYKEKIITFNKKQNVLIEHLQRDFTKSIDKNNVHFGNRFTVQPNFNRGTLLNRLLIIIKEKFNLTPEEVMSQITYTDVKNYIFSLYKRPIYLNKKSEDILNNLNLGHNKIWFTSHNKYHFKKFEEYVFEEIPKSVISDTLWCNKQIIYDKILSTDLNSFLSVQILSSIENNTRFISSGGASSLFQLIPQIKTIHHTIWDYYVLEYDEIKSNMLMKSDTKHILFHVGGILNNTQKIPFSDVDRNIEFMDVPTYSKKLEKYDDNILNYINEVGSSLINQKEVELEKIIQIL